MTTSFKSVGRKLLTAWTPKAPYVSIDFEFNPSSHEPTIVGLSSAGECFSDEWSEEARSLLARLNAEGVIWVGHNAVTVERSLIEQLTGQQVPLDRLEDTLVLHYLCNSELCKSVAKDEDDTERGAGFMDLWSMASLYTDLPVWKSCRTDHCEGPCRIHDPIGYNAYDALAVDLAYPALLEDYKRKRIPERLNAFVKEMICLTDEMQRQGIKVDRELVRKLEREFNENKNRIFPSHYETAYGKKGKPLKNPVLVWDAPFNPRAPQQVLEYFRSKGINLDSTEKDEILHVLNRIENDKNVGEDVKEWLGRLYDYKDAGKGLKPWFDERYFHSDGLIHPRFIPTGTSMGRLSSSGPNFQNIPARGFGKNVRRVIIPRDRGMMIVKADKSQLELRICLWYAGVDASVLPADAFLWLVEQGQGVFEKAAEMVGGGKTARDLSKSVSHGSDYLEGLKILYSRDLDNPRTKRMIDAGALVVHRDWEYHGGVVAFTGVNLAERLFGSASWENRKKALEIQEAYFRKFPGIRAWHKKLSEQAERGYSQTASGRYLALRGTPEDKLKMVAAHHGQGGGADDVQEGMLRYYREGYIPLIQVHDELVFEMPSDTPREKILDFFRIMSAPSTLIPGFSCPVKVSAGPNWLDVEELGKV